MSHKIPQHTPMRQRITVIVAIAILLALGLLSVLPYVAWLWPLELLAHFRVQYLISSLIVSSVLIILWRTHYFKNKGLDPYSENNPPVKITASPSLPPSLTTLMGKNFCPTALVIVALFLVGLNGIDVIPWYLPHSQQVVSKAAQPIRVLSFNLNIKNERENEVINVVRNNRPDIALFLEVDEETVEILKTGLQDTLPYAFRSPAGGLALLSRFPIQDARGDNLNGRGGHNLIATIEVDKKPIQVIGTHPIVPVTRTNFHRRNLQLAALTDYIRGITQPLILIGDFNLTPWSPYYRQLINKTKLHNTRLGFGILPSWPRPASHLSRIKWLMPLMNIPIDHCLVSKHFSVARIYTGANADSDHASLITDLVLR